MDALPTVLGPPTLYACLMCTRHLMVEGAGGKGAGPAPSSSPATSRGGLDQLEVRPLGRRGQAASSAVFPASMQPRPVRKETLMRSSVLRKVVLSGAVVVLGVGGGSALAAG